MTTWHRSGSILLALLLPSAMGALAAQETDPQQTEIRDHMEQTRQKHAALLGVRDQLNQQLSDLEIQHGRRAREDSQSGLPRVGPSG